MIIVNEACWTFISFSVVGAVVGAGVAGAAHDFSAFCAFFGIGIFVGAGAAVVHLTRYL